ncbi:hypothetical protein VaNZ11_016343 [Volvox africanus]|uniref:Post-SET domain-containing protein n=1 Tax=Volvox africanus TaxID=51714 RepID=A0ABQ5SQ41_9CHLO|nr:hypothetical protein VaNZ11_016343 [Volvox africanus]
MATDLPGHFSEMTKKIRVCVLQCSTKGSSGVLSAIDPHRKPEAYDTVGEFEWTNVFVRKATSCQQILELALSGNYDIFMNLCDGGWDEDRAGMDVVEALERLNLPYTGADRGFFEPSKVDMKIAAQQLGVTVPAWVHIKRFGPMGHEGVEKGLAEVLAPPEQGGLSFPLIVKHPSGYSSVGMTKQSKVFNEEELRQQVDLLVNQFGGALVEEFVEGREFTVLVVEEPKTGNASASVNAISDAISGSDNGTTATKSTTSALTGASSSGSDATACDPDSSGECTTPGTATAKSESKSEGSFEDGLESMDAVVDSGGPFCVVAYMPVECAFTPGEDFKHFQLKWHDYDTCSWHPCLDPELAQRLKDAALKTFIAMYGVSYGRCDFRVDSSGEVYLLEMNSNCGMLYPPGLHGSGDFILTLDPHRDHMHFIRTIINTALQRHHMRQPKVVRDFVRRPRKASGIVTVAAAAECAERAATAMIDRSRHSGSSGRAADGQWGLVAVASIHTGEVVRRGEQLPVTVASRGWLERCYPSGEGWKLMMLRADAYPLGDEVWVTRPEDPSSWAPFQHSCDPNTWFRGLDVVARRDIQPGEIITIDFATFRAGLTEPFDCCCGSDCCRGRVTGTDYLAPWLGERYGSHVSPYVAAKRRRAGLPV